MDTSTESIITTGGHWLDGLLEVDPYAATALVCVTILATGLYLWRRLRRPPRLEKRS